MASDFQDPKHEEKSDVESFLEDIKHFWDKFGLTVLILVLAVLIVLLGSRFFAGREDRARDEAYATLAASESPFAMEDVAEQFAHVPGFASYARLRAADLRAREALGLVTFLEGASQPTEDQRKRGLEDAAKLYQQVIEGSDSSLQVANARLGLASVYESLGAFEKAGEQYRKAGENTDWPILAARAKARLDSLDSVKDPVEFPPPPPKPEPGADVGASPEKKDTPAGLDFSPELPSILEPKE